MQRSAEFRHPAVGPPAEIEQELLVTGVGRQIDQFIRVGLKVVKKFKTVGINIPDILEPLGTDALKGWNPVSHGEVLVKGFPPPVDR